METRSDGLFRRVFAGSAIRHSPRPSVVLDDYPGTPVGLALRCLRTRNLFLTACFRVYCFDCEAFGMKHQGGLMAD